MMQRYSKTRSGLTLIEIMVAAVVVIVGVLGAIMYRYNSALHARRADVHVGAGRSALLVLEGWKGAAGVDGYDPQGVGGIGTYILNSSDISISAANSGVHTVELTGASGSTRTYYYVQLSYSEDVDGDGDLMDDVGLRKLDVDVTYYGNGSSNKSLPAKTIKLSDYVRTN